MQLREKIKNAIAAAVSTPGKFDVLPTENDKFGHYFTNIAFGLAKTAGRKPIEVAEELSEKIKNSAPTGFFLKVEAAPPGFINFLLSDETVRGYFAEILPDLVNYGRSSVGKEKTVIVEYSQPNIAKKMHVGHLRTTIIGDVLANTTEFLGYKAIRWNYLGDWGTQFGKLIAAYKMWGDEKAVKANPINTLQELYVRFHDEMKLSLGRMKELEKQGREEFKKLEEGDKENRKLWKWFKDESLKEFGKVYDILGVRFDTEIGESFYEKDIKPLAARLIKDGIAKISEGAVVIPLEKYGLPPALIQKSDGASLYLTRDIANLEYRIKKYKPEKILYVVGNEQSLHFEQLFAVADILGLNKKTELAHVKYGLVLGEKGKKLATREGRAILLESVLGKALDLARKIIEEKNADLAEKNKKEIAEAVGIGALKYGVLKENRNTDIAFDWNKILAISGDSAPYLQYTYARLRSVLRKAGDDNIKIGGDLKKIGREAELQLMRKIFDFPDAVSRCGEILETNNLTEYLYKLAVSASRFYETTPIIKEADEARRKELLALVVAAATVLKSGLDLLGIEAPERI